MSDAGPPVQDPAEPTLLARPTRAARGMFQDPVVRNMSLAAMALIILFLALVMGVVLSGVTAPSGPRTLSENELNVAAAAVHKGKAGAATWGTYIAALIADGQYSLAQSTITDAKASVNDSATAEFSLAEARLHFAQKQYQQSIAIANKGQKQIEVAQKAIIAGGGDKAKRAKLDGLSENWYTMALLKADDYTALRDWAQAIKELDVYIAANPGASDILIDRGNAKIEVKDIVGAKADFREALRFIPNDPEALKGLDRIGAAHK